MKSENYYEILNVHQNASTDEIRNAFLRLSKKFHPDKVGQFSNKNSTEKYIKINEAYQVLSKHASRTAYDFNLSEAQRLHKPGVQNINYYDSWTVRQPTSGSSSNSQPYGVKWIPRVSNISLMAALLFLGISGGIFGFFSVHTKCIKIEECFCVSRSCNTIDCKCLTVRYKLWF
uniref:J domain-containing protein n=1 Tax=Megaselia scalaris TaxID=36166 RepID=T1GR82_MEGSC